MSKTYSISELAKEFDITTRTIRFYEDKGMITPQRNGQTRIYSPADRTKLKLILRGKRLGFSLDESFAIIDMYNPKGNNAGQLHTLIDGIRERRLALQRQMKELQDMLQDLDDAEQRCREALPDADTAS
ncbi:MAG: liu genes transcriptional regulator LiuR [Candidatus Pelagadaptatus aseana]|uniref:MerR family transcriptional regulator n=1 Tax=Candidatus Pelagadaptatus aseana TaxID=3120508 RepID=UPI0039B1EFCB